MVKLPSYEWFMGLINFRGKGNVFSGSMGSDPMLGITSSCFRYSVWIEKNENDEFVLKAAHYIGLNAFDSTDKDIMTMNVFEASTDGIHEAEEWIKNAADEFYDKNGAE